MPGAGRRPPRYAPRRARPSGLSSRSCEEGAHGGAQEGDLAAEAGRPAGAVKLISLTWFYLLRNGQLSQITHDDTYVQSLVDSGKLTAEEASHHPRRSMILRALDGSQVDPDISIREARLRDRYLRMRRFDDYSEVDWLYADPRSGTVTGRGTRLRSRTSVG